MPYSTHKIEDRWFSFAGPFPKKFSFITVRDKDSTKVKKKFPGFQYFTWLAYKFSYLVLKDLLLSNSLIDIPYCEF